MFLVYLYVKVYMVRIIMKTSIHLRCPGSPWHLGDIETLEEVQRRAVNYITGLKGATYEDKLMELGILSLANRRIRADLIQVLKF